MKKESVIPCGASDGPSNDAVAHYVLLQSGTATEHSIHTVSESGDDEVCIAADPSDLSGTATGAEWPSTSASSPECPPDTTAKKARTRRKHSLVWEHFDHHSRDKYSCVCKHCAMTVRLGKEGGCGKLGTTAMRKHLENHHAHLIPGLPPRPGAELASGGEASTLGRRKRPSSVWQHFDHHGDDKFLVVCKICKMRVRLGKEGGCDKVGTTAMHKHVTIHHRFLLQKNPALGTGHEAAAKTARAPHPSPPSGPARHTEIQSHSRVPELNEPDPVALNHGLARYMANGLHPFSLAEEPAFLEFMRCCAPHWCVPSKTYFARGAVPALATMIRERVRKDLKACVGKMVHLGVETWQGPNMSDLVSISAFWVKCEEPDMSLARCKAILEVINLGESCSLENISQALGAAIQDWLLPLELEVGSVVSERCPSTEPAFRDMRPRYMTCMAHCLDSEVENTLFNFHNQLGEAFEVARAVCIHVCSSEAAKARFKAIQSHHNLRQRPLVPDCPADWKRTLRMVKLLCEQKLAVNEYLKESRGLSISPEQWLVLRDTASVLQPVEEVIRLLSMNTASLGQVLPLLCFAEKMLQATMERSEVGTPAHWLASHLISKLATNSQVNAVKADLAYWTASFLDPRFRDTFCSYIDGGQATAQQKLKQVKSHLLARMSENYARSTKSACTAAANPPTQQVAAGQSLDEDFSLWLTNAEQMGLTKCKAEPPPDDTNAEGVAAAKLELEAYVQDALGDFSAPMSDPTHYWQAKRTTWPSLFSIAAVCLACPPTNTYSEKMFAKYGAVASEGRQGISVSTLSLLCFIRMNHEWVPEDVSAAEANVTDFVKKELDKEGGENDSVQVLDEEAEVLLKRVFFSD